ncbi:copper resistance protein B [Brevundimonas sp.]|uniref:copper resistance protein B n=1 Tax=Brevundimonas sp. TaxID=1871086 RepID=UPI003D6D2AC0
MSRALFAAVAVLPLMLAAGSAVAQSHGGHGGHGAHAAPARPPQARPRPAPKPKPRAAAPQPRRVAPPAAASAPAADPHAGHDMSAMQTAPAQAPAADPHAGHNMAPTQTDPHAGHDMSAMTGGAPNIPTSVDAVGGRMTETPPPAAARAAPAHAADLLFDPAVMAASRKQLLAENGDVRTTAVLIDSIEAGFGDGEKSYSWNAQGWTGGDINRFWWKTEGEGAFDGKLHDAEVQALYSRAVAPFWDVQAGVRQDFRPDGEDATHLTVGVQGVAPYWFEMSAAAFLSTEGELTARAEAEYDQRITQKWILQPAIEVALSASDIPELEIGSGLTSVTAGLRLRYEIRKEFAPYVGVEWSRAFGDTADYARARGDDVDATRFVVGIKAWF